MVNPIKVVKGLLEAEEELGEFIAGPTSSGFGGHIRDGFRHRCDEFANLAPWAQALSGSAGGSINRFCTPYWAANGYDGPTAEPPFTGGQCPKFYRLVGYIEYTYTFQGFPPVPNRQFPVTTEYQFLGPIESLTVISDTPGLAGNRRFFMDIGTAAGVQSGIGFRLTPQAEEGAINPRWVGSFEIEPGEVDNCGDPDAQIRPGANPPPNPGPLPGPEPTDNPDPDNPIPFLPIPPYEDPTFGPQPVTGPNQNEPAAPEPAPPAGGDGLPGTDDAIAPEAGEANGDEGGKDIDFGPPPEGRVWVGAIVQTVVDERIADIPGTGPISSVWPTVRGNVALKFGSFYGRAQRVNSKWTDLFRPSTAVVVTGVFIQVQKGGLSKVFPVSAVTCPENPCGDEDG